MTGDGLAERPPTPPRIRLLGVEVDRMTEGDALAHIASALAEGRGGWVVTPNLDHLRRLVNDPAFAALCASADLRLPDGMPLVWASRLQGTPLPARVAGSDFIWSLCEWAARNGRSVFLLGGNAGSADAAAARLCREFPALRVVGAYCPPVGFESDPAQVRAIHEQLTRTAPDIVFVGLGSPKQERLIVETRPLIPRAWLLGVGVSFSFVAGDIARAPVWMRRVGLEWLHRLAQEPRRLASRYLVHGVPFALRLLISSGVARMRGVPRGRDLDESDHPAGRGRAMRL